MPEQAPEKQAMPCGPIPTGHQQVGSTDIKKTALITAITGQDGTYLADTLLGWQPRTTFKELVRLMVKSDLARTAG